MKLENFFKLREGENNRVEDTEGVEEKGRDWWSDAGSKVEAVGQTPRAGLFGSEEEGQG